MKYINLVKYSLIVSAICLIFFMPVDSHAAGMAYSVKATIPENQIDKEKTYFDLLVKPGATQELELEIKNTSKETLKLYVEPKVATTNQNGELEYSIQPKKYDSTLTYPITKLLSEKQAVTIDPLATKKVTFTLKAPQKAFSGKIVGGFNIYEQSNEKAAKEKSTDEEVQIKNLFSFVLGIQIRESTTEVKPKLKLNDVKASLFNYRTAITANIQNTEPTFLSALNVKGSIRKIGSKDGLFKFEQSDIAMAPNSNFDLPISLENQEIESGNYEITLAATSKQGKWNFTKRFNITNEEAKQFNAEAVELVEQSNNKMLIIMIVIGAVVFLMFVIIIILLWRKKQ
jgi:hypothetical protein